MVAGEMELIDTAYTESFDGACTTHILAIWLRAGAYQLKVQLASIDTPLVSGTYPQAVNRCGERKVRTIATLHHVLDDGSGTQLLGVARQESAFALPELERDPASGELAFRLELRDIIFEPVAELADQHPAEAAVEHTISATIETRVPITRLDNRPR